MTGRRVPLGFLLQATGLPPLLPSEACGRIQLSAPRESRVIHQSRDGNRAKTFDALEQPAAMCSHVPNKAEQMVKSRYGFPIRHVWQPKQGFRVAAARNNGIRYAKSLMDLKAKSVKKKWKDKRFAAGVDRSIIERGAGMLGVDLSELITDTITGMREVAGELGLKGEDA